MDVEVGFKIVTEGMKNENEGEINFLFGGGGEDVFDDFSGRV